MANGNVSALGCVYSALIAGDEIEKLELSDFRVELEQLFWIADEYDRPLADVVRDALREYVEKC